MIYFHEFCMLNKISAQAGRTYIENGIINVIYRKVKKRSHILIDPKEINKVKEDKHYVKCPLCKSKLLFISKLHLKKCPFIQQKSIYSELYYRVLRKGNKKCYSDSDKELLKKIYENSPRDFIKSKFPGKSWRAIRYIASRLELKRNENLNTRERLESAKNNSLKKYGVESPWQLNSVKEKSKQTNIKRRGVEYALQSSEVRAKINKTVQDKYGVDNVFQLKSIKEKIKQTNIEKFGVENPNQNPEILEKSKNTNIKRYGVENPFQMVDRVRTGMLKKYGKKSPMQIPEFKEKAKKTNIERYGFPYSIQNPELRKKLSIILRSDEVRYKKYRTSQKKKSFNSSTEEKTFFEYLVKIDPNAQTHRLHPLLKFVIDYYSPKYGLWIQFDGTYWHGKFFKDRGTAQSESIKNIMNNDKIQNENIPNLIRFWSDDSESSIKNDTIIDMINTKIKNKIEELKKDKKYNICYQYRKKLETYEDDLQNIPFNPDTIKTSDFTITNEVMSSDIIEFIEKYEWLGTIGRPPKWCFTAKYKGFLGGVVLINEPNSYSTILGKNTITYEALIQRGATASWTPKNLSSRLIMTSCKWMVQHTAKRAFVGYADPQAGERGVIYQACGFDYIGHDFGTTLSESEKIEEERKMKYVLVRGKNKIENHYLNSIKTYSRFDYPKKVFKMDLSYNPPPTIKPTSGKTRNRKNPHKIEFLIQNHGKMSRSELAASINESVWWVKRQIAMLAINGQINVRKRNESITEWPEGSENRAIELRREFRKTNEEIVTMLLKEFGLKISPAVLQTHYKKTDCRIESKQEWLKKHLSSEQIWDLLNKNYRMVDITNYLKEKYQVYISDDQIQNYLKTLGIPSLRQKILKEFQLKRTRPTRTDPVGPALNARSTYRSKGTSNSDPVFLLP